MQANLFSIYQGVHSASGIRTVVSFEPFIRFVQDRIRHRPANYIYLQNAIDEMESILNGRYDIPEEALVNYKRIYEIIYGITTRPLEDEQTFLWGLAVPFSPLIIYYTDGLINLLEQKMLIWEPQVSGQRTFQKEDIQIFFFYEMVLKKLYHISPFEKKERAYIMKVKEGDAERYYAIEMDANFIDVTYDGPLPDIDLVKYEGQPDKWEMLEYIKSLLPLSRITVRGISTFQVNDITLQQLQEKLKALVVDHTIPTTRHHEIAQTVKGLLGNYKLDVILSPIFVLNNTVVEELWHGINEDLNTVLDKYQLSQEMFADVLQKFTESPCIIYHKDIKKACNVSCGPLAALNSKVLSGIILNPIYADKKLVGVIAIFAGPDQVLSEDILSRMEKTIPLLEKLFESTISHYRALLDRTLKNKFTSIQPSVEWKFNEAAIQYLQDKGTDKHPQMRPIHFEDVHPVYGAIDIRDSTLARNQALSEDLILQLNELVKTFDLYNRYLHIEIVEEYVFKAQSWIKWLEQGNHPEENPLLTRFLDKEAMAFLREFEQHNKATQKAAAAYYAAIAPDGECHSHSTAIERTFKILNNAIASLLDQMNDKLQMMYPSFFERYRSDGIEYNIYIGQSIAPNIPFHAFYLKNIQLWQVNTMAIIARITEELQPQLPHPLRTTQLIFIHSNTIDISFRMDEHRFDVEGSYNIRYEIIKKRIDKALIKGTGERLTQPGKIAIAYFNQKDVEDYIEHIHYLQDKKILSPEVEYLDIEELQGVNGLKAIRVSVDSSYTGAKKAEGSPDGEMQILGDIMDKAFEAI